MKIAPLIALVACVALPCGCDGPAEATLTPVPESADWPASSPEAEQLDPLPLGDLVQRIRRGDHGSIASLLIVRHGRLVVEEYFSGWNAERPHTMQSVSKSVVSLVTGLAVGMGQLAITDTAIEFFPGYQPIANLDAAKAALTVRDLLTMKTGCARCSIASLGRRRGEVPASRDGPRWAEMG